MINAHQDAVELGIGLERASLTLRQARLLAYSILLAVEDAQEPQTGS